jgi:hypothetical protein
MEITIPGDGFCGTHALFLRMLMTLYTRDATLTKLQSSLEDLQAIDVAHTEEPYDKPGMIEVLQPIVSAFPLQEQIYAASSDKKTGAGDVLARAIDYIQRSISELQRLEQNDDFDALRNKFRNALGPNSTQDDFNAAARDIIMAFIQSPSGNVPDTRTLPNYHAMLRAFMETIVESHTFRERLVECEQVRFDMLKLKMDSMMSQLILCQDLYQELFDLTFQLRQTTGITEESYDRMLYLSIAHMVSGNMATIDALSAEHTPQGEFARIVKDFYTGQYPQLQQKAAEKNQARGTPSEDQLDHYCQELARALIHHQSSHTTPIVDDLLRFNIAQSHVADLYESPNMGNLLTCFGQSGYSRTICDSSLYTEASDIMVVNDLFPLLTISDNILGVALEHVGGNHFDMRMPDSGFFHSLLLPSPTASAEVHVSTGASPSDLGASAPPSTQQNKGKPATGADQVINSSSKIIPHGREHPLLESQRSKKDASTNSKKAHSGALSKALGSDTQASQLQPATKHEKKTLSLNLETVTKNINTDRKRYGHSLDKEVSAQAVSLLDDLLSQVQSTRAELEQIGSDNLSNDDYKRLNGALKTVNFLHKDFIEDIRGYSKPQKSQKK